MSIPPISPEYISTERPEYAVECIGEYSLDENAKLELGRGEAKYVHREMIGRHVRINLLEGMDRQESRSIENLNKIFHWLMETAAPNSVLKDALGGCEFVCRRGVLLRIAKSPYELPNDYKVPRLACIKYKGIYFLVEDDRVFKVMKMNYNKLRPKQDFADCKFKRIMTSNDPNVLPNPNAVGNPNTEFGGIFKATLTVKNRPISILCSGEIDGILKEDGENDEFVKLKIQFRRMGYGNFFSDKALTWFFQSHLIGIKRFVIGIYEKDFFLNKVEYLTLDQLLGLCDGHPNGCPWNVDVCLNFLHAFLEKIKSELDALPEGTILVAERPDNGIEFQFTAFQTDHKDYGDYEFIGEDFKAHGWKEE